MIGVVLLQKSEGGGLVSTSTSGFMTGRGTANVLTRTTALLAVGFLHNQPRLVLACRSRSTSGFDHQYRWWRAGDPAGAGRRAVAAGATRAKPAAAFLINWAAMRRKVRTGGASRAASTAVAIGQVMLKASTPAIVHDTAGGRFLAA